jgi:hypothetical protein
MFRSFSTGSLCIGSNQEAWAAPDDGMASSNAALLDSCEPVFYFPLDTAGDNLSNSDYAWLASNLSQAFNSVVPPPAQAAPPQVCDVISNEIPSTCASSNNNLSNLCYDTSITVPDLRKLADLYDNSTRLIVARNEQGDVIVLLPAPQVSHHIAKLAYS